MLKKDNTYTMQWITSSHTIFQYSKGSKPFTIGILIRWKMEANAEISQNQNRGRNEMQKVEGTTYHRSRICQLYTISICMNDQYYKDYMYGHF